MPKAFFTSISVASIGQHNEFVDAHMQNLFVAYSRHIDIREHYLRELCLSCIVKLIPLRTHQCIICWPTR